MTTIMQPNTTQILHAGVTATLAICKPCDGVHLWRAIARFERVEPRDGEPLEQTVSTIAQVTAECSDIESGIARLLASMSTEESARPARLWIAPIGHMLHVMASTTGESLRCRLVTFGMMLKNPEGAELVAALHRTDPFAGVVAHERPE